MEFNMDMSFRVQHGELPTPLFKKRAKKGYSEEELKSFGDGTTWEVLSDPIFHMESKRRMILCKCKVCGIRRHVYIPALIKNQTVCIICKNQKYVEDAEKAGLTLVGENKGNPAYRTYVIDECGHEKELRSEAVQKNIFFCRVCLYKRTLEACKGTTFTPNVSVENCSYLFKATCNVCGTTENKSLNSVGKCKTCLIQKYKSCAEKHGSTWIRKLSGNTSLYKLSCGHEEEIKNSSMENGSVYCSACYRESFSNLAGKCGATVDFNDYNKENATYACILECGCKQYVRHDYVKRGYLYCRNHNFNVYSLPSNIYLLKIKVGDFSWLKLGMSKDISKRIQDYKLDKCSTIDIISIIQTKDGFDALREEKKIHKNLSSLKIDQELMKVHMKSGFTECYPIESEKEILAELEKYKNNNR